MPWSAKDAARHNKHLSPQEQTRWSQIANSILKKTGDDGQAIRVANSKFEKGTPSKKAIQRRLNG